MQQAEATSKEDVLTALCRASSSLRHKLGESLASVQKFDAPVEATTSSLEALNNYSVGIRVQHEQGDAPAIPFYKRAIELDPNFPLAYANLAVNYLNLQQPSLALEYATKAYQLRDRVTEREKLRISANYFYATGEIDKEAETYELWIATYLVMLFLTPTWAPTTPSWGNMTKLSPSFRRHCGCRPKMSAAM